MGAAAILGGSMIGGGLISTAGQLYANERNINFSRDMANTSHQREVQDLLAAGLNPILSATKGGNGAPSPQGNLQNPTAGLGSSVSEAAKALAVDVPRIQNETRVADANSARAEAETRNINADTIIKLQEGGRGDLVTEKLRQSIKGMLLDQSKTAQDTKTSSAQENKYKADTALTNQETRVLQALVPFLENGSKAVTDLITWAKGGAIGNAAADIVEAVKKALPDFGSDVRELKQLINTVFKKLLPSGPSGATPEDVGSSQYP